MMTTAMLEGLLSTLTKPVPPVPPVKKQREPLEGADLLEVPPVPPGKTKTNAENTKPIEPKTNPSITCKTCIHFESYHAHGGGAGICNAEVMPYGACHWADTVHQCGKYLSSASSEAVTAPPAADDLTVTVWTPNGTALMTRADNAEHAAWLRQMNPKPASPAPKPPMPEPDTDRISEAEHNAQGRYFKFLATWPDGGQCCLCQMPRQTVDEMRAQYPAATDMEPVLNEDYPHD